MVYAVRRSKSAVPRRAAGRLALSRFGVVTSLFLVAAVIGCRSSDEKLARELHLDVQAEPVDVNGDLRIHVEIHAAHALLLGDRELVLIAWGDGGIPRERHERILTGSDPGVPGSIVVPFSSAQLEEWLPPGEDYSLVAEVGPVRSNVATISRRIETRSK